MGREGRCPARGGGRREACGTPAGAEAPRGRRAAGAAEPPRGPMPRDVRQAAWVAECPRRPRPLVYGGPRNAREGRCPAHGGGLREACGTPARTECPAWRRRPAGACRNARGGRGPACTAARMGRGTPARTNAPRVRRPAECPRNPRGRPMPRVYGGVRREACGMPARAEAPCVRRPAWVAEPPREADAPRVRRPAECLPNARGRPMPPAHNAGGTHSASPQTVEQSFARGLPGRGSAGPSARRGRPPANPAACAVNQAS